MKRRILLVDDEVAVLLTMKAVLEISGFEVETAASAREGKHRLHTSEYHMIITDMRMESDESGREVIRAAREASYHPAVALLTAFPVQEEDWQDLGADKLLLKPMHTRVLLEQIDHLFESHDRKLAALATASALEDFGPAPAPPAAPAKEVAKKPAKSVLRPRATKKAAKNAGRKPALKKASVKASASSKAAKKAAKKLASKIAKKPAKKPAKKLAVRPARKPLKKR
jgi:DNA-binding response OmpR family regulator